MGRPGKDKISRATHSLNEDRSNKSGEMRSKSTVKRLKMYRQGKARRNAIGKVVHEAAFQSTVVSGKMARVDPNRKWFGNTKVIAENDLLKFQEYNTTYDPYQVVMRKTVMPVSITMCKEKKKPDLSGLHTYVKRNIRKRGANMKAETYAELADCRQKQMDNYNEQVEKADATESSTKNELLPMSFKAGTSNRIYKELFKVIDSSDVLLYVLDVRDPQGTRSPYIENYLRTERPNKHLIFVLNKVDLVPVGITKHWRRTLSKEFPTVAFFADMNHPFGKFAIIGLLRQFGQLHKDRRQISVGVIGYPNAGKSSLINTLRGKQVVKVAPIPGETKVWQYVSLSKTIHLIDCPGVVSNQSDTETDLVLKSVIRTERVPNADMYISAVIDRVGSNVLNRVYALRKPWNDSEQFLEVLARQSGRLLKGGEADLQTTAKRVLSDFQRGKLPYYNKPPDYDNQEINTNPDENLEDTKEWIRRKANKEKAALDKQEAALRADEEDGAKYKNSETHLEKDEEVDVIEEEIKVPEHPTLDSSEFASGKNLKQKKKINNRPKEKQKLAKTEKMTCKQRRKIERAMKEKKTGNNFYDRVDAKNRRTKF